MPHDPDALRSLRELFEEVDDFRTDPALKHPLAAVLSLIVLGKLRGLHGGRQVEIFAKALPQQELEAVGCCYDRRAKVYRAPSDTTFTDTPLLITSYVQPSLSSASRQLPQTLNQQQNRLGLASSHCRTQGCLPPLLTQGIRPRRIASVAHPNAESIATK